MPQHPHHSHEHHHGFFHACRSLYLKSLDFLGEKFAGRANAGKVGSRVRKVRLATATISVLLIIVGIILVGGVSFFTGGAPLWIIGGLAACAAINFFAIPIGWGANHVKAQQVMDAEIDILEQNNQLRDPKNKKTLPHGMKQTFKQDPNKFWMNAERYAHDGNAIFGSVMDVLYKTLTIIELVGVLVDWFVPVGGWAMLASRVCATISPVWALRTSARRWGVFKQGVERQIDDFYELKKNANKKRHQMIDTVVEKILHADPLLNINRTDKYYHRLRYFCYKSLDTSLSPHDVMVRQTAIDAIRSEVKKLCKPKKLSWFQKLFSSEKANAIAENNMILIRISHKRLMHLDSATHEFALPDPTPSRDKVAVVDALSIFEHRCYNAAAQTLNTGQKKKVDQFLTDFSSRHPMEQNNIYFHAIFMLKKMLIKWAVEKSIPDFTNPNVTEYLTHILKTHINMYCETNSITKRKTFSQDQFLKHYPVKHAHGKTFLMPYHTQMFANDFFKKIDRINLKHLESGLAKQSGMVNSLMTRSYQPMALEAKNLQHVDLDYRSFVSAPRKSFSLCHEI